ncbi:GNAT family N-acetyltransferase [Streptomyces profundus]|uniref:GNAT family N-acetyltransferase n=1 Tax=Streptomyces profundus TaxID=2867410 RepID=UPI001D16D564|nr:GNAT family protein [Streptomyces sp. MA3_2.13]UED82958.1 GNAT family N-acetyltransferase [Streptomyces sp. MA3_2.13]
MRLRGYRDRDRPLLTGTWLPGELLGLPLPNRPALAAPTQVPAPAEGDDELCVVPDVGFARFTDIDWVSRRARLEIGWHRQDTEGVDDLLTAAVAHGRHRLNLRRLHGLVTPLAAPPRAVLTGAGFRHEATVPEHLWLDGRAVSREIWGCVDHG